MVSDPTASASSSQTWVAIMRRVKTLGDRRSRSSTSDDSIAVKATVSTGHGDLPSGRIEPEISALQYRSRSERWAALQGMDTGNQLGEVERPDQVVVGTSVEARDPVPPGVDAAVAGVEENGLVAVTGRRLVLDALAGLEVARVNGARRRDASRRRGPEH